MWGQFNPHNPDEPSMDRLTPNYDYAVYKNGVTFTNKSKEPVDICGILEMGIQVP